MSYNSHRLRKHQRIHHMVMDDRRLNANQIANGVLLHQDNALAHKPVVAMATVRDCSFELVDHLPYSPYLAPSDYFLFPTRKRHMTGKQYRTDNEVVSAVEDFLEGQDENFYTTGIQALQHRCKKCMDRSGDYIEKKNTFGQV
ncbi:histone-lysine N-methyltransferase SETMAR-like [Octopus sinensis]|uniref:Histone-lysine N-methyltransferase SETMAR-like n=1 Tax=Octopus sinensis TaxID=2607531 RepID=A0A6P7TV67_9MOLL|nr:histone-lysine N-methyltransferase SETMAR-like [Octopus sinensis]